MLKTWTHRLLPVLILLAAAAIAWLMIASRAELPRRQTALAAPVVETMTVRPGPVPVTIHSRGTVTPKREIELVSEVSGRVVWVAPEFLGGGMVREGDILLRIDPIDYEVALSEARAALASARLSLAEVKVVVMRAAIEEAEAQVAAAEARLRQAEVDLQNTEIRAPFDAIVDVKHADLGQFVGAGGALMTLLGTEVVEVRLPVLPSDLPYLRYGRRPDGSWYRAVLTARFGRQEHRWQARLVRLEQRVDDQTRVFYVVAEVDQPYDGPRHGRPLTVGQFVEATITGAAIDPAVRIPRTALHDSAYVFLVEAGRLKRRQVELLRRERDSAIVGQGLADGDRVLLSRLDLMVEDMPVVVGE
jgi:RND family efflux transporter MFP subunit